MTDFDIRTQVAEATRRAQLAMVWFTPYDAQRVRDPVTFAY